MTYREAINFGECILAKAGIASPKNDAWRLFEMVCGIDRSFYYLHMQDDLSEEQFREYELVLGKRAERIPLQYIVGETEFMGLRFWVNSSVLIPRQDTETLVEQAIKKIRPGMRVLDLCTGSGCIIISILHNVPGAQGYATDISRQALGVAQENAKQNGVSVDFKQGDLFEHVVGKYDVIVSNPPYIESAVIPTLMPEVRDFEPLEALDGKEDGLYFYKRISRQCSAYLTPGGEIFFEIGYHQGKAVSKLLEEEGFLEVQIIKDLARNDRVVTGRLPSHIPV